MNAHMYANTQQHMRTRNITLVENIELQSKYFRYKCKVSVNTAEIRFCNLMLNSIFNCECRN